MKSFDVVIAGGAMAGATLALALAKQNPALAIAVVEAVDGEQQAHPGYDARSIALASGSVQTLKQWGLWDGLQAQAEPIRHIHVSDRGHAGITRIDADEQGVDALGHVVELANVGQYYQQQLKSHAAITFYCPDVIASMSANDTGYQLTLSSGALCHARLVVAADGGHSSLSNQLKLTQHAHDFEQVALIANVTTAEPHGGRAFERFTENGPLAMLPMREGRSSLVWCLRPEQAAQMAALDDGAFLAALQRAFGWRLGALTQVGKRDCYPLLLRQRQSVIAHRAVVIGNAAQSLHPIAGQGFNLGLRDVAELVAQISASDDPGAPHVLQQYQANRQADRQATIALTSGLVALFSNCALPLVAGRNLGLMAMGQCRALQSPLVKHTMGIR
ncbi:2-octaprenyl-6-methoxyphenyl hydroxylase [Thaumasiovibrio subtropicus]|uniref:2-octaprenyl-6-methoxyphenyl hydroxylase n=1 Tax=Thaumasiovibrio subtropicus TaxID=1891207 RepID=UPI000B362D74|nr:2-octaprenyl-6-methoxyphenyl hydroxylase [Thaumasiovibrio subtropicus]